MLLDKLLPKLQRDGHRVLIFSQLRIMLDIIEDYMVSRNWVFERVDGSVTGKKRQASIDRYMQGEIFAMLLSTRAGEFVTRFYLTKQHCDYPILLTGTTGIFPFHHFLSIFRLSYQCPIVVLRWGGYQPDGG